MKRLVNLLLIVMIAAMAAGCTGPGKAVDPRTMAFAPLKFDIPKTERVQLANGMVVFLLEDHELPIVNITSYIYTGSIYEPADKVGLAKITATVSHWKPNQ